MNSKEKAKQRFIQQKEVKIVFIPQCCKCEFNIDLLTCKKFNHKNYDVRMNNIKCSEFKTRQNKR